MKQLTSAFVAEPQLLEELEKHSTPLALGENRVLFREGEAPTGVYILWRGTAVLTRGSNGDTVLTVEAPAGSVLGLPAVVGTKTYSLTAVAMEDAELSVVSCDDFVSMMQEPQVAFQVLKVLAEEVRFARETLTALWRRGSFQRRTSKA